MKIGVITIHWANNYGSALQVFATVKILAQFGDVSVIDYRSVFTCKGMMLLRYGNRARDILRMAKDVFRLLPRYRVIKKFKNFNFKYFNMTEAVSSDHAFEKINEQFDFFVSGSDQIWNPKIVNEAGELDTRYFLDFVDRKKKISYASSLGTYVYSKTEIPRVVNFLNQYSHISVRENDTVLYLSALIKKPIVNVLDPTLLLTKQEWMQSFNLEKKIPAKPYILVYALKKDKLLKNVVELIAQILKIRVITIDQDPFTNFKNDKHLRDIGPDEFVNLFSKAQYVITNSFHGCCFAVNLNIPFIVTTPPTGINRIESLLISIGLANRVVSDCDPVPSIIEGTIDFSRVNVELETLRVGSMEYIKNALN